MSLDTLKSFANLHDDYAFFEGHSSETEASLSALLPLLGDFRGPLLQALDFGAGSGSFSSRLLEQAAFDPAALQLTLVEPDRAFRDLALLRLAAFSTQPITAWPLLDRDVPPTFDLIVSHHVLYYVPDLETTLRRLSEALLSGGRALLVQGGQGNGLNRLVWAAFAKLGESPPYNYSENTESALLASGTEFRVEKVHSALEFPDSQEGRWRILRFLLGDHLAKLSQSAALSLFEPFQDGPKIRIPSSDELFIVEAR